MVQHSCWSSHHHIVFPRSKQKAKGQGEVLHILAGLGSLQESPTLIGSSVSCDQELLLHVIMLVRVL